MKIRILKFLIFAKNPDLDRGPALQEGHQLPVALQAEQPGGRLQQEVQPLCGGRRLRQPRGPDQQAAGANDLKRNC